MNVKHKVSQKQTLIKLFSHLSITTNDWQLKFYSFLFSQVQMITIFENNLSYLEFKAIHTVHYGHLSVDKTIHIITGTHCYNKIKTKIKNMLPLIWQKTKTTQMKAKNELCLMQMVHLNTVAGISTRTAHDTSCHFATFDRSPGDLK